MWVVVARVDNIETVKGMDKPRQIVFLRLDEAGEAVLTSAVKGYLEEFNNCTAHSFDVVVCRGNYHRLEGVGGGSEGSNNLIQGRHDAQTRTATAIW